MFNDKVLGWSIDGESLFWFFGFFIWIYNRKFEYFGYGGLIYKVGRMYCVIIINSWSNSKGSSKWIFY